MDRREFVRRSGMAAVGLGMSGALAGQRVFAKVGNRKRLNVLMITAHDLGRHLGCYGIKTVSTENLDALAAKGIRFENYFAVDCVCSPSRGGMLTGRYPQSNGLMGLTHQPWGWSLNGDERHIAAILGDAGFETILVGLQHVTGGDARSLGYQKVYSKERKAEETVQAARELLGKAKKGDRHFFMKVGFFEVHRPFTVGEDTEKGVFIPPYLKDTPEIRRDLAQFQGTIRFFDKCVGQILEGLENSDVAEETLVVFTADHGIPYPGAKWCLYDPGIETPLIMYQPGTKIAGGKVFRQMMSNVDLLPTILDLLGVDKPGNLQGYSFKGVIEGDRKPPRNEIYAQRTSHALRDNTSRTIRTEQYKLIRYFEPGRVVQFPTDAVPQKVAGHTQRPQRKGTRPVVQLFDIQKDPHERNDIGGEAKYAEVVRELSDKLWRWMEDVGDPILKGPLVKPYYEKAMEDYRRYRGQKGRR